MNEDKIILDLCGGSGSWSRPYREAGYDVYNITLPEFDVTKAHIDPVSGLHINFPFANQEKRGKLQLTALSIPISRIHGILAAPPCTMFSIARSTAKTPRDFIGGMLVVQSCLQIVWWCRAKGNLQWWALENPVGFLRQFLGKPPYSFRQWWFGEDRSKPTDLWGYFNDPKRLVQTEPIFLQKTNNGVRKRDGVPLKNRNAAWYANGSAADRAITPPLFAKAFFKANP